MLRIMISAREDERPEVLRCDISGSCRCGDCRLSRLLSVGEQGGERIEPRILSDVGYGERQRPRGWLVLDADERAAVPLDGERV